MITQLQEATMKAMKTEFVKQMQFENLEQLETELFDYVNFYTILDHILHYRRKLSKKC